MIYRIANDKLSIAVSSLGAELVSAKQGGTERLWQNETGEWAHSAPVLFPVCGNCGVWVNGAEYPIKPHGFAKFSEFALVDRGEDRLTFELCDSPNTRAVFPYAFRFRITYRLGEDGALFIEYEISAPSAKLSYACGGHESYALANPVGCYELVFPEEERFVSLLHDGAGRLTGKTLNFGAGKVLPLPAEFLREGRTLIFSGLRSRSVILRERGGRAAAQTHFNGFENLLLWHAGDSRMICIEPWQNLPDAAGEKGEFPLKKGVRTLQANEKETFTRMIRYFDL